MLMILVHFPDVSHMNFMYLKILSGNKTALINIYYIKSDSITNISDKYEKQKLI